MNLNVRKCPFGHLRPTKTEIKLGICDVWSELLLFLEETLAIQNAPSEDYDQTPLADLNLRRVHLSEGTLFDVAADKWN